MFLPCQILQYIGNEEHCPFHKPLFLFSNKSYNRNISEHQHTNLMSKTEAIFFFKCIHFMVSITLFFSAMSNYTLSRLTEKQVSVCMHTSPFLAHLLDLL